MRKFSIEDDVHAEWQGDFETFDAAIIELQRRAALTWDAPPNQCPCTGWKTCERIYTITEFIVGDETFTPQNLYEVLSISSRGVKWLKGFENYGNSASHNNP